MSMTKTQRKRYENATFWFDAMGKPANKAVAAYRKQIKMQADAANRRVEKRKGKTRPSP